MRVLFGCIRFGSRAHAAAVTAGVARPNLWIRSQIPESTTAHACDQTHELIFLFRTRRVLAGPHLRDGDDEDDLGSVILNLLQAAGTRRLSENTRTGTGPVLPLDNPSAELCTINERCY